MPYKKVDSDAVFSFETIAALIAASGVSVSTAHFELMAQVDPSRTASGYEHLFRAAKKRAKEIQAMQANGELANAPTKSPEKARKAAQKDGEPKPKAKRGRKARDEESPEYEAETAPKKKVKKEKADSDAEAEVEAAAEEFNWGFALSHSDQISPSGSVRIM